MVSAHTTHGRKSAVLYLQFDGYHFWQEAIYLRLENGIYEANGPNVPINQE